MTHYPVPSHAAQVWVASDTLWLSFPPLPGNEFGHSVSFPASPKGLMAALETLVTRSRAADLRLGFKGTPTQWEVEKSLKDDKKYNEWLATMKVTEAEREEAGKMLEELGL